MGFVVHGGGRLEDLIDETAGERATKRIADAGGDRLLRNVQDRTPVQTGRLLASISRGPVTPRLTPTGGIAWGVTVGSDDPKAPHVEWTTRPHDIPGAFGRPYPFGVGGRFEGRFHPGTTGQHMFSRGAIATLEQVDQFARPAVALFRREVTRER